MKNNNEHFFWYAKRWYKWGNIMEDLKVIQSRFCGIPSDCISDNDIIWKLTELSKPYIENNEGGWNLHSFINNASPEETYKIGYRHNFDDYDYNLAVVHTCLATLRLQEVDSITKHHGDLIAPDYSMLEARK